VNRQAAPAASSQLGAARTQGPGGSPCPPQVRVEAAPRLVTRPLSLALLRPRPLPPSAPLQWPRSSSPAPSAPPCGTPPPTPASPPCSRQRDAGEVSAVASPTSRRTLRPRNPQGLRAPATRHWRPTPLTAWTRRSPEETSGSASDPPGPPAQARKKQQHSIRK